MSRTVRSASLLCAAALWAFSFGCGSQKGGSQPNIFGSVKDLDGSPVVNATLTASGGQRVNTDANGHFQFDVNAQQVSSITVTAPAYGTIVRGLLPTDEELDFSVRAADIAQSFAIPTAQSAPQNFAVQGDSASNFSLSIPPDSIVDANGNAVSGEANIKIVYWDPNGPMQALPANLLAHSPFPDDNDTIETELLTFGMFEITIEQAGQLLQIAENSNFVVTQTLPADMGNFQVGQTQLTGPAFLWYLDPNSGAWRLSTDSSFDANTNILQANLPHLSSWNFDNFSSNLIGPGCTTKKIQYGTPPCQKTGKYQVGTNLGGCIQGTIKDKSGKPVTGTGSLWLFSSEGVYMVKVPTDSSGHFCYNASLRAINGSSKGYLASNTIPTFTSALNQPDNSASKNPMTSNCETCQSTGWCHSGFTPFGGGQIARMNNCSFVTNDFTKGYDGVRATPLVPMASITSTVYTCAYCPGTAPSSCPVPGFQLSNKCAVAGGNNAVNACPQQYALGSTCTPATAQCCPAKTICADGQCVPASDTSVSRRRAL